jgi:putative MATE family efflux protein
MGMASPETQSQNVDIHPNADELDPLHTPAVISTRVPEAAIESPTQLRRRVIGLAAPVIGENLLQTLLGVVDTILVAGVGAVALAGVGAALQVIFVIIAALSALTVGTSVLVAQAIGAEHPRMASSYARQSIVWSVIIAIPLTGLGLLLTRPIINLFGMTPDVAQVAVDYLHVTLGTIATLTVMLLAGGVLRGAGDSRTPMFVTALVNVVNVGLAYGLIYGHFGFPALGPVGSAWGTFGSRLLGAALLVVILFRGRNGVRIGDNGIWWPHLGTAWQVLKIGFPAALEEVFIITAFAVMTPIVAHLGTLALAAHRVVINILSLSFLPGIGFGLAATALVGQSIGARRPDEARAVTAIALRWAIVWMGSLGVAFIIFAPHLMRLFTSDPDMIAIGASAIRVVAFTQPLWAASFVYAGALRGTGNTHVPLLITGVSIWAAVGLGYLGILLVQPSLSLLWAAFLITGPLESLGFWWAWRRWRH